MTILLGIAAVGIFLWALGKGYLSADGGMIGQLIRQMGGFALIGTGVTLATTGRFLPAVPCVLGGLWLLGYLQVRGLKNWSTSNVMRQRSQMLDIGIDGSTGRVSGTVTAGAFSGRALDSLSREECYRLAQDLNDQDLTGLRLFAAYLDGRFPGWREDLQGRSHAGSRDKARPGVMTDKEAYQILGLGPGADEAAIREAHRRLITKIHPDLGGSDALAALVNEAKDTLLRRHR
jgi:hypothetical protein